MEQTIFSRRRRVAIDFDPKEGRTNQSFVKDTNINEIMKRFQATGQIISQAPVPPSYGYVSSTTFHEAMNIVTQGEQLFDSLPSGLRKRFHHDPAEFMEFALDDANREEMANLGLLNPEAARAALEAAEASLNTPEGSESPDDQPPVEATDGG